MRGDCGKVAFHNAMTGLWREWEHFEAPWSREWSAAWKNHLGQIPGFWESETLLTQEEQGEFDGRSDGTDEENWLFIREGAAGVVLS